MTPTFSVSTLDKIKSTTTLAPHLQQKEGDKGIPSTSNLPWWGGLIIGLVCLGLVAGIVGTVLLVRKRKQKKAERRSMKGSKNEGESKLSEMEDTSFRVAVLDSERLKPVESFRPSYNYSRSRSRTTTRREKSTFDYYTKKSKKVQKLEDSKKKLASAEAQISKKKLQQEITTKSPSEKIGSPQLLTSGEILAKEKLVLVKKSPVDIKKSMEKQQQPKIERPLVLKIATSVIAKPTVENADGSKSKSVSIAESKKSETAKPTSKPVKEKRKSSRATASIKSKPLQKKKTDTKSKAKTKSKSKSKSKAKAKAKK